MAYKDLLLDPRWQRKRLEVLQRENFTCQDCGATDKTLHVHHTFYGKGRKPWEYEASDLRSLCADCHASVTTLTADLHQAIGALDPDRMRVVLGFVNAQRWFADNAPTAIPGGTVEEIRGVLNAFGIIGSYVNVWVESMALIDNGMIEEDMLDRLVTIAQHQIKLVDRGPTEEERAAG